MVKRIDSSSIIIERIIVHNIPKHLKGDFSIEPNYSEQESKLSDGLRLFFKDKVVQSLNSDRAFKICFNDESTSPISWIVNDIFGSGGSKIIDQSKLIAKHLFEIQVGSNAAGILVIIFGKVSKKNTCIILKLERDKGAQLTLDQTTHSYNIQEVKDLMLTQKTKIFKSALFIPRSDFETKYDGIITDYQIDIRAKKEVRTWFMDIFLGCIPFEDPKITTQYFYNYTKQFVFTLDDEIQKAKYIQDLNSYIQKNNQTLSPKEFADDYLLTSKHKNDYKNYLLTKNFTFSSFPKDTSQIDRLIKKFVVSFENGISIIGKDGTFNKNVKLENLPNGQHRAEIRSKILSIK
ncbi:MAG: nucleoid-associated protein [Candidatus Tenebribacter burtonii]|nr:nucleoid-associated protein [Candidatus Tenebribacter burtonii]